jgi:hypothetical protein
MSETITPSIGQRYCVERPGESFIGEVAAITPYQVGLRVDDEDGLRWVRAEELREIVEDEEPLPTLAECRDMLAIVMATLERYEQEETGNDR